MVCGVSLIQNDNALNLYSGSLINVFGEFFATPAELKVGLKL